jgi:transcriptional regulator with XRE-family HTH domain
MLAVMGERVIKIKGPEFARLRERNAYSQPEFAQHIGISVRRINQIESAKVASIFLGPFRRMAELLKIEIPELRKLIGYNGHSKSDGAESLERSNIELGSEVAVPEIPLFDLPLAAGDWMEITDLCEVNETQMSHGLFRVRLQGDSMKPVYPDRTVVEFRCLRSHLDEAQIGKDYYVQRSDGYATFKRLEKIDEHTLVFAAINKRKYPKRLVVARQEISRLAVKVAKVILD